MEKRGQLLAEETLKIVIALIGIGLLVYFLTSLYLSSRNNAELGQAKATLPFIIQEANVGRTTVTIYNPKDWWILYLDKQLCICKEEFCTDENKVCQASDFSIGNPIQINNPPTQINVNQQNKTITKT